MSLIVTSNIALEDRPETSEAFKPYSYQNRLLNTFKIPPKNGLKSGQINNLNIQPFWAPNYRWRFCKEFGN